MTVNATPVNKQRVTCVSLWLLQKKSKRDMQNRKHNWGCHQARGKSVVFPRGINVMYFARPPHQQGCRAMDSTGCDKAELFNL